MLPSRSPQQNHCSRTTIEPSAISSDACQGGRAVPVFVECANSFASVPRKLLVKVYSLELGSNGRHPAAAGGLLLLLPFFSG